MTDTATVIPDDGAQEGGTSGVDDVLKDVALLEAAGDEDNTGDTTTEGDTKGDDKTTTTESNTDGAPDDTTTTTTDDKTADKVTDKVVDEKTLEEIDRIELRQILREQKREIAALKALQTETVDDDGNRIPSAVEVLQAELGAIVAERGGMIDLMADSMREMPKYNDLDSVCSRANLDDIIEVIAKDLESSEGADFNAAVLEIEKGIWSMPNPYKYIYEVVKEFHPTYDTSTSGGKGKGNKEEKGEKREAAAVTTMQSTQSGSSDSDAKGGWTAERVDNLSEEELNSVPADVYKKYMRGELN
jgi:hypothetical protein